jgi:hypothetical protein
MKKLIHTLLSLTILLIANLVWAQQQNSFTVVNPNATWFNWPGEFKDITITLEPKGVNTEVGLYFSVSAERTNYPQGFQMEAVMNFNLPAGAVVNDSWLWVDGTIIQAKILDVWTASAIYEGIVNRRQDPSILTKRSVNNDFTLRIFPVPVGTSRKVKLSYLLPGLWNAHSVESILPANLFTSTTRPIPDIEIRAFLNGPWRNPKLASHPDATFTARSLGGVGTFQYTVIKGESLRSNGLTFAVDSPQKNGVFVAYAAPKNGEGAYEVVVLPKQLVSTDVLKKPQHLMVLLQFNPDNSPLTNLAEVKNQLRIHLQRNLSTGDFFNIMVASSSPKPIQSSWIPVSSEAISSAIDKVNIGSLNLPGLLAVGNEFIKNQNQGGNIFLLANTSTEGSQRLSNELMNDLGKIWGTKKIPHFIFDIQTHNLNYTFVNSFSYLGNQYLYQLLSQPTGGEYLRIDNCCPNAFGNTLNTLLSQATAVKAETDIHASLESGFCFNRFSSNNQELITNLKEPFVQVGKYRGNWPMVIGVVGSADGTIFQHKVKIDQASAYKIDSAVWDGWTGAYIQSLEKKARTNVNIQEIIRASIGERVLSLYTAFLALEPSLGGEPCLNCQDRSQGPATSVDNNLLDSLASSKVFPNPFIDQVSIQLKFKEHIDLSQAQAGIYDQFGRLVWRFSDLPRGKVNEIEFNWNGQNGKSAYLPAGLYYFRLTGPQGQLGVKLMKR